MIHRGEGPPLDYGFHDACWGVSRAGYYAWVKRQGTTTPSQHRRDELSALARSTLTSTRPGFRRMLAELARRGVTASAGLVRKLMGELGGAGYSAHQSEPPSPPLRADRPDLLCRDFTAEAPGQSVTSPTCVPVSCLWLLLAVHLFAYLQGGDFYVFIYFYSITSYQIVILYL